MGRGNSKMSFRKKKEKKCNTKLKMVNHNAPLPTTDYFEPPPFLTFAKLRNDFMLFEARSLGGLVGADFSAVILRF